MRVFSTHATRVVTPLALAISAALGAMPVYAQEGSKTDDKKVQTSQAQNTTKADGSTRLQAVTVSSDWLGAPTEESVKTYPGARDVVTETELHQSGSRTVEDALRLVPGVRTNDETGVGTLPNIGIRGLNPMRTEQTMILVDGIPVTLAPYGQTGMSLFPLTMETVDRIDVARGGVAVHYGPNNVGGVVNFITRPIPQKMTIGARENLTISENGHVLTDTFARVGGFVSDRFGIQLMANRIDGQSYREHSDTKVNNLMLDADWLPTDSTEIKGRLQYYDADTELPGALAPAAYEQDREQSTRPYDFFKGDTVRGSLVFNKTFANQNEFSWTNFGHRSERIFGFASVPAGGTASTPANAVLTSPRNYWVFGTEPRYTFNLNAGAKQKIMLGARYMREEVDFIVDSRNLATGAYTVPQDRRFENDAYAAYASDTFSLLNDRLKITPGVRYESVNLYFRNNSNGTENRNPTRDWLPGLDIGYQANDKLFVFANYHESLRPVQFVHIALGGDFVSERANNYEAGLRLTPVRGLDTTLTYFRFDFDNKIELNAGRFRNLGEARHQGLETELNWSPAALPGLDLQTSYTYLDTEQLSGATAGNELPFASRHQFTTMANYRAGTFNWNVNGSYFSSAFSDAANNESEVETLPNGNTVLSGKSGIIPAYWLWNAQVSKDFRLNNTPMQIGLGVNNIFDEDYYFRGVDYSFGRMPGQGRSYLLKLGVNI